MSPWYGIEWVGRVDWHRVELDEWKGWMGLVRIMCYAGYP